jgi:hypothetical protein
VQWRFDLDDARLPRSPALDVLLDDVDALDDHSVAIDYVHAYATLLAFIPARSDKHGVATPNLSHPFLTCFLSYRLPREPQALVTQFS